MAISILQLQLSFYTIYTALQSGKTTLLQGLVDDINATDERIALYFTVESVQAYPDPHDGIAKIVERMRTDLPRDGARLGAPRSLRGVQRQDAAHHRLVVSCCFAL